MPSPNFIRNSCLRSALYALLILPAFVASGTITFPVTFVDPNKTSTSFYSAITAGFQAAGAEWATHLSGSGSLEVQVEFTTAIARVDGSSYTSAFVRNDGTRDIYEQGAASELHTGVDPNGATPDIRIRINPTYLANTLWLDPHPTQRTDTVPSNKTDAMSDFLHELAHAFAFSGFINGTTGERPATYQSTFDALVTFDGTNFFFNGSGAKTLYGGPVPITFANPTHLGNVAPRPGQDLESDLMFGPYYLDGTRYYITDLDLAIVKDTGVALQGHPAFFSGEASLGSGAYYLQFPNGMPFGYYSYLTDANYLYHYDLGYEYIFDAADGMSGVYFYDFTSSHFFYTSPTFPFPYLYDFTLNAVLYYYPDPDNAGHYNTDGVRYFYNYGTGKIITQ